MKNFLISLVSSDPTSVSSTRFAFLLAVILSNFVIFGVWIGLSLYFGKLLEIPESVIILYGIANGISVTGKMFQNWVEGKEVVAAKKLESKKIKECVEEPKVSV